MRGRFLAPRFAPSAVEDRHLNLDSHRTRRHRIIQRRAQRAIIAEGRDGRHALHAGGAVGELGVGFALLLRLQVGALLEGLRARGLHGDRVHRQVLQLVGQLEIGIEPHIHGAQELQVRGAAGVLRHQELLPVVGELHLGASDLDARTGAGFLLILRLFEHRFRERDIGLCRLHVGIALYRGQISAGHLRGHLLLGGIQVGFSCRNPDFGRLVLADGAEVEHALRSVDAGVDGGERPHEGREAEARDRDAAENLGIEAQTGQILGAALIGERSVDVGQQGSARFQRARLCLLERFIGKLYARAAFRGDRHLDSLLQAQLYGSGGQNHAGH